MIKKSPRLRGTTLPPPGVCPPWSGAACQNKLGDVGSPASPVLSGSVGDILRKSLHSILKAPARWSPLRQTSRNASAPTRVAGQTAPTRPPWPARAGRLSRPAPGVRSMGTRPVPPDCVPASRPRPPSPGPMLPVTRGFRGRNRRPPRRGEGAHGRFGARRRARRGEQGGG